MPPLRSFLSAVFSAGAGFPGALVVVARVDAAPVPDFPVCCAAVRFLVMSFFPIGRRFLWPRCPLSATIGRVWLNSDPTAGGVDVLPALDAMGGPDSRPMPV